MTSSCHPLSWYVSRIGKKIKRGVNNRKSRGAQPNRKSDDVILIHNKPHAEYLFMLQEEQGYRYTDLNTSTKYKA